ncbi:MAG: NTP transferase domain-containing protein [Chloroflexi bacterium]|nr:NTP transferase domain-containing protein [Chloroflexota bacterium]
MPASAIVLAAGAGRRFGGGKLLAHLDGRPILQHVLDALAAAGIDDPVVVLGDDEATVVAEVEWRSARRVRNPRPARGLSSSLKIGWNAALAANPALRSVLVVLGDQPRLDPDVVRTLIAQPLDPGRPIVVARHLDGARNPVRLEREAGPLVAAAVGDRGLGPLLDAHPELVRMVDVDGRNPDIDAPEDLVQLLAESWAASVQANATQVERVREVPDGRDFYAPVTRTFVADPARSDDAVLVALLDLARPGETWLDIGAGAGRYALPLARRVRQVIALDSSRSMLDALRAGMVNANTQNVRVIEGRWPPDEDVRAALGPDPVADVALIAHVGYDIVEIVPFLRAMERAASRRCVAILMDESPASVAAPFWPLVHGEPRSPLPALPRLLELLDASGSGPNLTRVVGERRRWTDREELVAFLRRQLWTAPGSPADERLLTAVEDLVETGADGSVIVPTAPVPGIGVIAWGTNNHQLEYDSLRSSG